MTKSTSRNRGLAFESLEDRRVMAVGVQELVADINPLLETRQGPTAQSFAGAFQRVGDRYVYSANSNSTGNELWVTDGNASPGKLLKDIAPGPPNSTRSDFTLAGDLLYFRVSGSGTASLWRTDGTTVGTIQLREFGSSSDGGFVRDLTAINETLYFKADLTLWKTDGTSEGTVSTGEHIGGSENNHSAAAGGRLYFSSGGVKVTDGNVTRQLTTGGAEVSRAAQIGPDTYIITANPYGVGTVVLKYNFEQETLTNVATFKRISDMLAVGDVLFLAADDGVLGTELWKITAAGPALVKDIYVGAESSGVSELTSLRGAVAFVANDPDSSREVWQSDGTQAGTAPIADTRTTKPFDGNHPKGLFTINDTLYFMRGNVRAWQSDGSMAGAVPLSQQVTNISGDVVNLAGLGDRLILISFHTSTGHRFYVSNGTSAGTRLLSLVPRGFGDSNISSPLSVGGGTIFFVADNGSHRQAVWGSAGTAANTEFLKGLGSTNGYYVTDLLQDAVQYKGATYFTESTTGLWKTDGTKSGTTLVKQHGSSAVVFDGLLYFFYRTSGEESEIWQTDGTKEGLRSIVRIEGAASEFKAFQTKLFFTHLQTNRFKPFHGIPYLWTSDRTQAGTKRLLLGEPLKYVEVGDSLFVLMDTGSRNSLYRIRGEVVTQVFEANSIAGLTAIGNSLYFSADRVGTGSELWKANATTGATSLVKDIVPGQRGSAPTGIVGLNGMLYFAADDAVHGTELWRSDGTAAGTVLLKDLYPGTGGSELHSLTVQPALPGTFYFSARQGDRALLWKSDGTAGGTQPVADPSGFSAEDPQDLVVAERNLFYTARDSEHGRELWRVLSSNAAVVLKANRGSQVPAGSVDTIESSELSTVDPDSPGHLVTYRIMVAPRDGQLELTTTPGTAVSSFTQADIDQQRLVYIHGGVGVANDSFRFVVGDSDGSSLVERTFVIRRLATKATSLGVVNVPGGREVRLIDVQAGGKNDDFTITSTDDGFFQITDNRASNNLIFAGKAIPGLLGSGTHSIRIPLAALTAVGPLRIQTGAGNDVLRLFTSGIQVDPSPPSGLFVDLGAGNDAVTMLNNRTLNVWTIDQAYGGSGKIGYFGTFRFSGVEKIVGGSADDQFRILQPLLAKVRLEGGIQVQGSIDRLEVVVDGNVAISNTSATVRVGAKQNSFAVSGMEAVRLTGGAGRNFFDARLFSGQATLVGNAGDDVLWGGSNNDFLYGGDGNDILVGNHGSDLLQGGNGRDLLIGGLDKDTLNGGPGDDILQGGTSYHDGSFGAQRAILVAWTSASSYDARRAAIMAGVGVSRVRLNTTSARDDNAVDTLIGGVDRDWFFAELSAGADQEQPNNTTGEAVDDLG